MCGTDYKLIGFVALNRQFGKNPVEHAQDAPADEPVVDRPMRPQLAGESRQRRPFPNAKMMLLAIRRGSRRGMLCDSGN